MEIMAGRLKGRPEAEQQSGKQAHRDGKTEYAKIRFDPDVQRQTGGVEVTDRRKHSVQKWHRGKRENQSARRAGKGEQRAFGQHLTNESASRSADRDADGDLLPARRRAREQ